MHIHNIFKAFCTDAFLSHLALENIIIHPCLASEPSNGSGDISTLLVHAGAHEMYLARYD